MHPPRPSRRARIVVALTLVAITAALAGCSSDGASSDSTDAAGSSVATGPATVDSGSGSSATLRQDVLDELAEGVMVPAYQRLADATAALATDVVSACATPADPAALDTARTAWSTARADWLATRAFRFGPATTLRTMSTIDFPIDSAKIDTLIADPAGAAVTSESLAALGSDQRGLGAIEHVLFADTALDERACAYLAASTSLVAAASADVLAGWTTGADGEAPFVEQITNPGQGGMYADEHEAYEDLINSMIFALADVADARIGRASGDVTGTPEPEEVDAGSARRARQDAIDIVAGVQLLFVGDGDGAGDGRGVGDVVESISADTRETMDAQLDTALAALDALPQPLADATDSAPAHAAYEALKAAQVTLRAEIASQLGVTLTFGDADGDS